MLSESDFITDSGLTTKFNNVIFRRLQALFMNIEPIYVTLILNFYFRNIVFIEVNFLNFLKNKILNWKEIVWVGVLEKLSLIEHIRNLLGMIL